MCLMYLCVFVLAPHIEDLVLLPSPVLRLLNLIDDSHLHNEEEYEGAEPFFICNNLRLNMQFYIIVKYPFQLSSCFRLKTLQISLHSSLPQCRRDGFPSQTLAGSDVVLLD